MRSAFALLLLLATLGCIQASVLIESGPLNGTSYRSAEIYRRGNVRHIRCTPAFSTNFCCLTGDDYNTNFETITGLLVHETVEDVNGKIVYIEDLPKRELWGKVIALKDRGAISVIHGTGSSTYRKHINK